MRRRDQCRGRRRRLTGAVDPWFQGADAARRLALNCGRRLPAMDFARGEILKRCPPAAASGHEFEDPHALRFRLGRAVQEREGKFVSGRNELVVTPQVPA